MFNEWKYSFFDSKLYLVENAHCNRFPNTSFSAYFESYLANYMYRTNTVHVASSVFDSCDKFASFLQFTSTHSICCAERDVVQLKVAVRMSIIIIMEFF